MMKLRKELIKTMAAKKARASKGIRSVFLYLFFCAVAVFPYVHAQSIAEPAGQSVPRNLVDLKRQITDYESFYRIP
jgi:hypothetical protein